MKERPLCGPNHLVVEHIHGACSEDNGSKACCISRPNHCSYIPWVLNSIKQQHMIRSLIRQLFHHDNSGDPLRCFCLCNLLKHGRADSSTGNMTHPTWNIDRFLNDELINDPVTL